MELNNTANNNAVNNNHNKLSDAIKYNNIVEKWDIFEVQLKGKTSGNPFVDYTIKGIFKSQNQKTEVEGFYDGEGNYKIRFMPYFEEEYQFEISGSFSDVGYTGTFKVTPPEKENHGPVRVAHQFHLAYEDGTPYYSIGTTCYVWNLQSEELKKKTLDTLANSPFNKMRFCVFPKHYLYNLTEPVCYPYEGTPLDTSHMTAENFATYTFSKENKWDFKRFNPEYFREIENQIMNLRDLGIEADIIIMHPYDRWGFSQMSEEEDDLYYHYIIARFAAFRNIWWSLANEYDLLPNKSIADWERYGNMLCQFDPYSHLRSIHNCKKFYDYNRPWITHCSIQRTDRYKPIESTDEWRMIYKKPIVVDEMCYEGNIKMDWGNITGQELVRRFWEVTLRGGYAGHGETFAATDDILWWSHGGDLHGESAPRLQFLYELLKETPGHGLKPYPEKYGVIGGGICAGPEHAAEEMDGPYYRIFYFGFSRQVEKEFFVDNVTKFHVEIIDTWDMTITDAGVYQGRFTIKLPCKQYMALRLKKIK